jgi:diguanylate cyclase (GGDEF)-like protein
MLTSDLNLNGLRVLIVEDDPASRALLSRMFSKFGADFDTAADGAQALGLFEENRYPVIVTDICMPGMNGLELVERVRKLDKNTQIIATSANRDTDCLISAIELGFNDYFLKPIEIDKLLWAVKRCADTINDRQRLEEERLKFQAVVESIGEGIAIKDLDFNIQYQNGAMMKMFGDRVGTACYTIFGFEEPCLDCPTVLTLQDGQNHSSCRSYPAEGIFRYIESNASLIRDSRGAITGTVEIIRDISERMNYEKTIRDLAFHDPLTGLANRRLFEDRLGQTIAKSRRYGMKFGLMYLDLDHFKEVNDTFGHEAGDKVLQEAASRIRFCCQRDLDTICRQGGDEFCIIFTDCGGREQLAAIAEKLKAQFTQPFHIDGDPVEVTVSIGISIYPDNSMIMKELEIAADRAMYAAKKAGRHTYRFWELNYRDGGGQKP